VTKLFTFETENVKNFSLKYSGCSEIIL